jgi:hypothetical protein
MALTSSLYMSCPAGGPAVAAVKVLGELLALPMLAGFALLGSEFVGVGCRRAERLALFIELAPSELAVRGGDAECVRGGVIRGTCEDIAGRGP